MFQICPEDIFCFSAGRGLPNLGRNNFTEQSLLYFRVICIATVSAADKVDDQLMFLYSFEMVNKKRIRM